MFKNLGRKDNVEPPTPLAELSAPSLAVQRLWTAKPNAGARDFQDLDVGGTKLYRHVARTVAREWNGNGNCLLVVGATYPEELAEVRAIVGDMPLLVPGVGAQGGDVESVVKNGGTSDRTGLVVSSSRAILQAGTGVDFAEAARAAAMQLRDGINRFR